VRVNVGSVGIEKQRQVAGDWGNTIAIPGMILPGVGILRLLS
jgi:hypothetical protein